MKTSSPTSFRQGMTISLASVASYFAITSSHSKTGQYLSFHLSRLQLVTTLVHFQIAYLLAEKQDYFRDFLNLVTDVTSLGSILQDESTQWFYSLILIATWTYIITILGIVLFIYIRGYRGSINFTFQPVLAQILQTHSTIVYWIVAMVLVIPFTITNKSKLFTIMRTENVILSWINFGFSLISFFVAGIASLFCIQYFQKDNSFSAHSSSDQFATFTLKTVMAFFVAFIKRKNLLVCQILLAFLCLISGIRFYFLYEILPYYSYKTMKSCIIWSCIEAWIIVFSFIISLFQNDLSKYTLTIIYLELILLLLIIKLSIIRLDKMVKNYCVASTYKLSNENQVLKKLFSLEALMKNPFSNNHDKFASLSELYLSSILAHYSKTMGGISPPNVSLHTDNFPYLQENETQAVKSDETYIQFVFYSLIKKAINKFEKSQNLKIILAQHLLNSFDREPIKAYICLHSLVMEKSNFFVRTRREVLLRQTVLKLKESLKDRHAGTLNIQNFIDSHTDQMLFMQKILSNTRLYLDFWSCYNKPGFLLRELFEKSLAIDKQAGNIEDLFEDSMMKNSKLYQGIINTYCNYLRLIRNMPHTAEKISEKYQKRKTFETKGADLSHLITEDTINLPGTIILQVSMCKEKRGVIQYASINGSNKLGYKPKDFIDKNINVLMSPLFAENHNQLISERFQQLKLWNEEKDHNIATYIRDKEGFILPCSVCVTVFPYNEQYFTYICILRVSDLKYQYIIFTEDGQIEGASKGISKKLNLNAGRSFNINEVCTDAFSTFSIENEEDCKEEDYIQEVLNTRWIDYSFYVQDKLKENRRKLIYQARRESITLMHQKFYVLILKAEIKSQDTTSILDIDDEEANVDLPLTPNIRHHTKVLLESHYFYKTHYHIMVSSPKETIPTLENRNPTYEDVLETKKDRIGLETQESQRILLFKRNFGNKTEIPEQTIQELTEKNHSIEWPKTNRLNEDQRMLTNINPKNTKSHLEQCLYAVPSLKFTNALNFITFGFVILCVGVLISFIFKTRDYLDVVNQNTEILNITTMRLVQVVYTTRNLEYASLYSSSVVNETRYGLLTVDSFTKLLLESLSVREKALNSYNTLMRTVMNQINTDLQKTLLSYKVPITEDISVMDMNIFDAVTEILLKVKKILANPSTYVSQVNPDRDFILRNSLNELLLGSEMINDIILKDSERNLDMLENISLFILLGIVAFGAVLLLLLICQQRKLIKSRNKIINIFLQINEEQLSETLNQVIKFKDTLEAQINIKDNNYIKKKSSLMRKPQIGKRQQKAASPKGLNFKHVLVFFIATLAFVILLMPFVQILILIRGKNTFFKNNMRAITDLNTFTYKTFLISLSLAIYMDPKGYQKIRGRPLEEEWNNLYNDLSGSQNLVFNIANRLGQEQICDSEIVDSFQDILAGNLCERFPQKVFASRCPLIADGAMTRGLQAVMNYILFGLKELKDNFDLSNKSLTQINTIMDSQKMISMEYIIGEYQGSSINEMNKKLTTCNSALVRDSQRYLEILLVLYIIGYIVSGLFGSNYWNNILRKEILGWRKILRRIPLGVVQTTSTLRNYLDKESIRGIKAKNYKSSI